MPQRAEGTSPDFPVLGTGQYDWKGFDPATQTADYLPFSKHPQAVDPAYLVSWNNKQAPEWAAADDKYDYGPLHRQQMIADKVRAGTKGKKKMTIVQLIQAMEEPATQDLRGYRLLPIDLQGDRQAEVGRSCAARWRRCAPGTSTAPTAATSTATGSTRKRRRSS